MAASFRWGSPLGIAVALFAVIGSLWIVIGVLSVPLTRRGADASIVFVSTRTDREYYGDTPSHLLGSNVALDRFRIQLITVVAGFLVLAGVLVLAVTWFALRRGEVCSVWTLGLGCAVAVAWWVVALTPYVGAGVGLTLADVPPFMWVPAVLIVPAAILGWIGTR